MILYFIIILLLILLLKKNEKNEKNESEKNESEKGFYRTNDILTPDLNYPSKGYPGKFHQVGILYVNKIILPLYGRMTYPGSNRYEYYTKNQNYNEINIPLDTPDNKLLNHGDQVYVSDYELTFTVSLYETHPLRYLPYFDFQKGW